MINIIVMDKAGVNVGVLLVHLHRCCCVAKMFSSCFLGLKCLFPSCLKTEESLVKEELNFSSLDLIRLLRVVFSSPLSY